VTACMQRAGQLGVAVSTRRYSIPVVVSAGLARVIIPERNMPDVTADLPAPVRDVLQIIPVQRLDEVRLRTVQYRCRCIWHVLQVVSRAQLDVCNQGPTPGHCRLCVVHQVLAHAFDPPLLLQPRARL
jgi:Lon protease (S16) C-terminal proteolytic domain